MGTEVDKVQLVLTGNILKHQQLCIKPSSVSNYTGILYGRCRLYLTRDCSSCQEWFYVSSPKQTGRNVCIVAASIALVHSTENSSWEWGTVKKRHQVKLLLKNRIYWSLCLVFSIIRWCFEKSLVNNEKLIHPGVILATFLIQTYCQKHAKSRKVLENSS